MKGSWRGANCTEHHSIDVVENEPIDVQRKKVEIETVNLTVLTNSLMAANLHNITTILSFVLFSPLPSMQTRGALMFSRGQ